MNPVIYNRKYLAYFQSVARNYKKLSAEQINPSLKKLQYAVRGPIVQRASELEKCLKCGEHMPFENVIKCNIGDCHASGQPYISFLRDVIVAACNKDVMNSSIIPDDAKSRAKRFLDSIGGSVGAYSQSTGVEVVREDVAKYIEQRDGIPANAADIFLSSGASEAVKFILELLATTKEGSQRAGVMIPIPQYPLYSATLSQYNTNQIGYFLDEECGWGLNLDELEKRIHEARNECEPRAIVVINPGNPTGQVLLRKDIESVLRFAHRNSLIVIADEVYQFNVYAKDRKFHSFKKVLSELEEPVSKEVQVASMMSVSKGYTGECGFRGGYCELVNFDPDVKAELYKCLSARLCPPVLGQLALDVVVNPPRPGEVSYKQFNDEKGIVYNDLQKKAKLVETLFNKLQGYTCQPVMGAMYAFPKLELPAKALLAAKEKNIPADVFYVSDLLEKTGICVVPGSGFGQKPATFHFRTTILPTEERMLEMMERLTQFHEEFMKEYN